MLTIRADESLSQRLRELAQSQRKTVSVIVREILEEALAERPIAARAGHLKARLDLPQTDDDPWRQELRERNWRP